MRILRRPLALALLPLSALIVAAGYSLPVPAPFTQGVIITRVALPGNPYDKLLNKLDPTQGDLQGQMNRLARSLTPAEQQQLQSQASQSPSLTMAALLLPRKGTLYCRGQEVRATTDALTYHLENYFNGTKSTGLLLLAAQAAPERLAYTYDAATVKKSWQTITITDADYTARPTTETALVAGYPSQKTTYILKPGTAPTAPAGSGGLPQQPVAIDVWTSAQIPALLNFAHPVYVKEKRGITKLVVYFDKEHKQQLLYEFASVQVRAVTPQELQIKTPAQVLDYAKDELQIGMKSLAIMLGGGPGQSTSGE